MMESGATSSRRAAGVGEAGGSSGPVDRAALVGLLREKRYEEAWGLLRAGELRAPDDVAIRRGREAIEEHLLTRWAKGVGGLDQIPTAIADAAAPPGDADLSRVLACIDGRRSCAEVMAASGLGRFEAYRALAALLRAGLLGLPDPTPSRAQKLADAAYRVLFDRATAAVLDHRDELALRLYRACLASRPDDPLAQHNERCLAARLRRRSACQRLDGARQRRLTGGPGSSPG